MRLRWTAHKSEEKTQSFSNINNRKWISFKNALEIGKSLDFQNITITTFLGGRISHCIKILPLEVVKMPWNQNQIENVLHAVGKSTKPKNFINNICIQIWRNEKNEIGDCMNYQSGKKRTSVRKITEFQQTRTLFRKNLNFSHELKLVTPNS